MNWVAVRSSAAGVRKSAWAVNWRHSAACVLSCESICARSRELVPLYSARKLAPTAMAVTSAIASASWARRPPGTRRLVTWHAQAVADVTHGLDRIPLVRVAELAAQVADVDLEHLGAGVEVKAPNGVEDLLAGENLIGMAHQVGEHLELARRQLHLAAVALHPAGAQIHADAGRLQHRGFALAR